MTMREASIPDGRSNYPRWATTDGIARANTEIAKSNTFGDLRNIQTNVLAITAYSLLYVGQLKNSVALFSQLIDLDRSELQKQFGNKYGGAPSSDAYYCDVALVNLLSGEHKEARKYLLQAMSNIESKHGAFTDGAGGVGPGLLLWYLSIIDDDSELMAKSLEYLIRIRTRSKKHEVSIWPSAVADMVLGRLPYDALMLNCFGTTDLDLLKERSNVRYDPKPDDLVVYSESDCPKGTLLRRHLTTAIFYGALLFRDSDPELFNTLMSFCCGLDGTIREREWFLAFYELGLFP